MTAIAGATRIDRPAVSQPWLHSARWDLTFVIFSILLAGVPYLSYVAFGGAALDDGAMEGTTAYNARLLVNTLVTLFIGGPHMYATFTRTVLDTGYLRRHSRLLASTLIVPAAVIVMAVASYDSYVWLLSIFFAMASLHALYQIIWLTDAYSAQARRTLSLSNRLIDYGLLFTSLYPIAVYKMAAGQFKIGPVALKYGEFIRGWYWLAWLAGAAFAVFLALWVVKSYREYRSGVLNLPKTLLIGLSVLLMFFTSAFANLDTSFQGVNTWHSFQYLALTWYANKLREQRSGRPIAFLHLSTTRDGMSAWQRVKAAVAAPFRWLDRQSGWTVFYVVCFAMLPVSGLLIAGARTIWPELHTGMPGADETYNYIGILSILLMHYVQDAFLFTDAQALAG